jgi:TonB family protein
MPSPQGPSGPDQRDSVFDLVIDQSGRVEQVHLVSPGNRFNDRMLIAAAKAWQFLPAIKDGQPVRYKLQIRIAP